MSASAALHIVPATVIDEPAPAAPRPTKRRGKRSNGKRRERGESRHTGVVVIKPRPGRAEYSLRYTDPTTGRPRQPRLPDVTTFAAAEAAAVTLFRTLQKRALEVTLAGGREHAASAATLREESAAYLGTVGRKVSRHGRPTSRITLRRYRDVLTQFSAWCEARGCTQLNQLTRTTLAEWLTSRLEADAHGHRRAVSTVNQEVKPVRQMLTAAALAGRLVHLSSDAVRGALARMTQPAPEPRCYSVPEVRAILRAALDFDTSPARPRRAPAMAPVIAAALLTGMRRGELAALQVSMVLFDAPTAYDPSITTGHDVVRLPASITKTGVARDVAMHPYSPLLGELLRALIHGRGPRERVFKIGYVVMGDYAWRLRTAGRGAPADFCLKSLRSTCATYQSPLAGNPKAKADRLGHTLAVAEQHYLALPSGTPLTAPSLESVMQCEPEVREIISRVLAKRA